MTKETRVNRLSLSPLLAGMLTMMLALGAAVAAVQQTAAAAKAPVVVVKSLATEAAKVNYPTYDADYQLFVGWLGQFFTYDEITDGDVAAGNLAGYKLAILPNNAVLSAEEIAAIEEFVAGGGKVLAVFSVGLRDPSLKLVGLQLGDLMGVRWIQWMGDTSFQQIEVVDPGEVLAGAPLTIPVGTGSSQIVEVLPNGRMLAVRASKDGMMAMNNPAVIVESKAGIYFANHILAGANLVLPEAQELVYTIIKNYAPEAVKQAFAPVELAIE